MAQTGAGRVVPEGYRPLVARRNGDVLTCLLADRDPAVYRRYGHWWNKGVPVAESAIVRD